MSQGSTVHLLNGVDGNSLTQGIYAHNKMLKFGLGGKYLGEGPLSYNHTRLREIELISIINVDNDIEVACNISKEFQKFNVYADYFDIIKWCNTHPHLVVSGHRSGTLKGIKFSQYFFGFTKDTISMSKIQEVFKVNG
jgi:hypothetical protein